MNARFLLVISPLFNAIRTMAVYAMFGDFQTNFDTAAMIKAIVAANITDFSKLPWTNVYAPNSKKLIIEYGDALYLFGEPTDLIHELTKIEDYLLVHNERDTFFGLFRQYLGNQKYQVLMVTPNVLGLKKGVKSDLVLDIQDPRIVFFKTAGSPIGVYEVIDELLSKNDRIR